jgi:hypothetical protein
MKYGIYDPENWENINPGWYKTTAKMKNYDEMFEWLLNNNSKFERHTRWTLLDYDSGLMEFKFRYEQDYIMFALRWS